jgi:hypothetical protein
MKPMTDETLDRLLSCVSSDNAPDGLSERILLRTQCMEQKIGAYRRIHALLADMAHDVFGHPGDSILYNVKWRMAGICTALLLGFSTGYIWPGMDDEDMLTAYALDELEGVDTI